MGKLPEIYQRLFHAFGPQHWWPGDSPFEVAVGAILTQNTNWGNVEKAIENLKKQKALAVKPIHDMPVQKLAELIKPARYFNVKAKRLKNFIHFLMNKYHGSMNRIGDGNTQVIRKNLLDVNGIGPETADSILLYALGKPVFVIDAYTKRVLSRHGIMGDEKSYDEFQELFHSALKRDVKLYNQYHALFVKVGKVYCRRQRPLCDRCPLQSLPGGFSSK